MALHPLNPHQGQYDLDGLATIQPDLKSYFKIRPDGETTLDFANDQAVKLLNQALLKKYYGVQHWDIPAGYLCPPVPGRADYVCRIAELLGAEKSGKDIMGLDVGTGANLIYPIVASQLFNWNMVGSEIDTTAYQTAKTLVDLNKNLKSHVKVRRQTTSQSIFEGIIKKDDYFHFTMCNPPFHASAEEANLGTQRKRQNLSRNQSKRGNSSAKSTKGLNFGGQANELWCEGGEAAFIKNIILESGGFKTQVGRFTTLVSKKENLPAIYKQLKKVGAKDVTTVDMAQGNKQSRFVAWSY